MSSSKPHTAGASLEDLSVIAAFVSVVRAGSFSGAARQLGMTKSAVSKRLARLEDRLGAQLLHRTTRAFSLTEAGQLFLERALVILNDLDEAGKSVASLASRPCGLLRIHAPALLGSHLGPLIPQFIARHPDVQIDLTLDDHEVDVVAAGPATESGRYDLAIRLGRIADSGALVQRLAADRLVVVGAPSYFERHGLPKTPHELFAHNCLRDSQSSRGPQHEWRFVDDSGHDFYVQVSGNFSCSQGGAMREAVVHGLGVALLPAFIVADELRSGRLRSVLDEFLARDLAISAVYPPARHASLKVRMFIDFLARQLAETIELPPPALTAAEPN